MEKYEKIMWAICLIPLFIGIVMLDCATTDREYSTDEYWVAKDYHHVYEKYSGQIVDYISENESCSIDGDIITVRTVNNGLFIAGVAITVLFGMFTLGMVWGTVSNSDWWRDFTRRF